MKRLLASLLVGGLCAAGATLPAEAAPITGAFTIAGAEDVRVGSNYADFGEVPGIWGTPRGDVIFATGTGTFAGIGPMLVSGGPVFVTGSILDPVALPVGTNIQIGDFFQIEPPTAANPRPFLSEWADIDFTLTRIEPGVGTAPPCLPPANAGDLCTPPGSPFTLLNNSTNSFVVGLRVRGFATNAMGQRSTFTANFSSQNTQIPLEGALAAILDDEVGFYQSSWSADFAFQPETTSVPEPANLVMMGLALSGMAVALRRRKGTQTE